MKGILRLMELAPFSRVSWSDLSTVTQDWMYCGVPAVSSPAGISVVLRTTKGTCFCLQRRQRPSFMLRKSVWRLVESTWICVRENGKTDRLAGTAAGPVLGAAVLGVALLSTRQRGCEERHVELDGGAGGAEETDVAVDGAGLAVAEDEVGADAQRVGADLVAETLPPAVARLDVHQRAVELPDEFDRARGDDAVDGVVETVGELAQRHQLDGLRVQRGTG